MKLGCNVNNVELARQVIVAVGISPVTCHSFRISLRGTAQEGVNGFQIYLDI